MPELTLQFNNKSICHVACDIIRLLSEYFQEIEALDGDMPLKIVEVSVLMFSYFQECEECSMGIYQLDVSRLTLTLFLLKPANVLKEALSIKGVVSPIVPSVPKCSSRHFTFYRKYVCFE